MATVNSTASSQVAYSYLQSKNKISGLVSGMDIDSIMEKLMKAESAQMEKLQQQKQKYEWKRDAYRDINTKLNTFQQTLFDKYSLKSSWNTKDVSVSSNTAVSVKAGATASGNLSISKVEKATNASQDFTSVTISNARITKDTNLANISSISGLNNDGKLNVFGVEVGNIDGVINQLTQNGYKASVSNGQLKISSTKDSIAIDDTTAESLRSLGIHFEYKTSEIKDDNNEKITNSTKLSDISSLNNSLLTINDKQINISNILSAKGNATVDDLIGEIKNQGFNASLKEGKLIISGSGQNNITSITSTSISFNSSNELSSALSKSLIESVSERNIQGSSTIQEILGEDAQNGKFSLNAVQADGSMKETTIAYNATDTIDSLLSKINSSGAGVTAIFNDGKLSISANNTGERTGGSDLAEVSLLNTYANGENSRENISQNTLELFSALTANSLSSISSSSFANNEYTLVNGGTDASITVNNVTYKQKSNVFNIAGYEIVANKNFESSISTDPITLSSTPDTDKAIEKVKEFVEMYNDLLKELNTKTTEKKKVGYDPLTDAQKAEMSDSEITKWEEAAKAGLLKGDTTLNTVLSSMRQTIFNYGNSVGINNAQGAKGDTLSSIGITTSSTWSENGKLEIDETKLRTALEKDPDVLSRIFTGDGSDENPGIIDNLRKAAQSAVKIIEKSAGKESIAENQYSLGKTISSLTTKIDDWKDRLKDIEERYWNQFSAMETAIQKANSQSSIFSS